MSITKLSIYGFRSLKNVEWSPGPLNVVIGPNASGKSNLLKAVRWIAMAASGDLADHVKSEGGVGAIGWNGKAREVGFELTNLYSYKAQFKFSLAMVPTGPSFDFRIEDEEFMATDESQANRIGYTRKRGGLVASRLPQATEAGFFQELSKPEALLSLAKSPLVKEQEIRNAQQALSSWQILDDMHTDVEATIRRAVISRTETRLDDDGQNVAEVLHTLYETDYEFRERIDMAMYAAFGDAYKSLVFPPGADRQVQLGVRWADLSKPQTAIGLSDGTLRFLVLITALAHPKPPALIAIDEPETGLHPTMMRIVAEYAQAAVLRTQVIFTTHSPSFLDGFSSDDPPITTVVEMHDAETRLKVVDPERLKYWLANYSLGTLYRSRELEQMEAAE